jgi:hypothetical protein
MGSSETVTTDENLVGRRSLPFPTGFGEWCDLSQDDMRDARLSIWACHFG